MHEERPLVIERWDDYIDLVISKIVIWIGHPAHRNKSTSKLPIFAVFWYKRVNLISSLENEYSDFIHEVRFYPMK